MGIRKNIRHPKVKRAVGQLETGVTAQVVTRPNAPSTFRPQPTLRAAQCKIAKVTLGRTATFAPPVYRPQPTPRVLQTKTAPGHTAKARQADQTLTPPGQTVIPPVYRSEAKKLVQSKAILQLRKPPTAPPVYRPEQKRIAQPKMASTAPMHSSPKTHRRCHTPSKVGHSVVQRMQGEYFNEEGLLPQITEELGEFAQQFNMSYSGKLERRR